MMIFKKIMIPRVKENKKIGLVSMSDTVDYHKRTVLANKLRWTSHNTFCGQDMLCDV